MSKQPTNRGVLIVVATLSVAAGSALMVARQDVPAGMAASKSAMVVDVVATDRSGAAVDDLASGDFIVTVGGVRRMVTSVRYVTRGPGAVNDTQSLQTSRPVPGRYAAEPARTVIMVIDQTTLVRGDEKATTAAVRRVIDRLGLDDRVGLVKLPMTGRVELSLTNDRPSVMASLSQVMGQATVAAFPAPVDPFATAEADRPVPLNPERAGSAERAEGEQTRMAIPGDRPGDRFAPGDGSDRGNIRDLSALFVSLAGLPGRKVVMLFSGGLTASRERAGAAGPIPSQVTRSSVEEVSLAATRAHAVVEAFALKSIRVDGVAPDVKALESLAGTTGGQFVALGKSIDQVVGRVLAGSSSCYVLGLEGVADTDAGHPLAVTTSRTGVVVRAPAWLVARADAQDWMPPATVSAVPGAATTEPPVPPRNAAGSRPASVPERTTPVRAAQLRRLLARVGDYVGTYQREYASVVAEEEYEQTDRSPSASTKLLRLTSDLLLVRVDGAEGWVAFRDVYEVNGTPLREREQRLQRLFLDPSVENRARLEAIQFESFKYNLGPVRRTVNTPLFSLGFLELAIQPRFAYSLKGTSDVDGLPVEELDYTETARPTIVVTEAFDDQPARGRFLIEPVSGAVVEARTIYARQGAGQIEYLVRYRRDEKLGLWLPVEMKETYSANGRVMTLGVARYRNFRRFQVTTDTQVVVPKK